MVVLPWNQTNLSPDRQLFGLVKSFGRVRSSRCILLNRTTISLSKFAATNDDIVPLLSWQYHRYDRSRKTTNISMILEFQRSQLLENSISLAFSCWCTSFASDWFAFNVAAAPHVIDESPPFQLRDAISTPVCF